MPITAMTFSGKKLEPIYDPDDAVMIPYAFGNNLTLARGTLIAELSATPGTAVAYSGAVIAPGAAPVLSDGGAGILVAATYIVGYTYVNTAGESLLSATQTQVLAVSHQIGVAAVTPLPTGAVSVNWYLSTVGAAGTYNPPMQFVVNNAGAAFNINSVPAANAALPPRINTAYVKSDGSQTPKGVLVYDIATDGSGNITLGLQTGSEFGETVKTAPVYIRGLFKCEDLTGLDANAVAPTTPSGFTLRQGSTTTGVVSIY